MDGFDQDAAHGLHVIGAWHHLPVARVVVQDAMDSASEITATTTPAKPINTPTQAVFRAFLASDDADSAESRAMRTCSSVFSRSLENAGSSSRVRGSKTKSSLAASTICSIQGRVESFLKSPGPANGVVEAIAGHLVILHRRLGHLNRLSARDTCDVSLAPLRDFHG